MKIDIKLLLIVEIIAFFAIVLLAVLWIRDSGGNYEPWTVVCGVVFVGIEIYRRYTKHYPNEHAPKSKKETLIHWIQENGSKQPLSHVLPKALQLAQLSADKDLEHWIRMELYGYAKEGGMTEQDTVPEYRDVTGTWVDQYDRMLHLTDPDLAILNSHRFRFGVGKLEELANKTEMQNIRDEDIIELIRSQLRVDVFRFCFSPVEITGILNHIRNLLLEKVNNLDQMSKEWEWNLESLEELGFSHDIAPLLLAAKDQGSNLSSMLSTISPQERYAEIMVDLKKRCPSIPTSNLHALAAVKLKGERFNLEFINEIVELALKYQPWQSKNHRIGFADASRSLVLKHRLRQPEVSE